MSRTGFSLAPGILAGLSCLLGIGLQGLQAQYFGTLFGIEVGPELLEATAGFAEDRWIFQVGDGQAQGLDILGRLVRPFAQRIAVLIDGGSRTLQACLEFRMTLPQLGSSAACLCLTSRHVQQLALE